jgi:flagellum-specific ATP synthase
MGTPMQRIRGRILQVVGPILEAELPGASVGALCVTGDGRRAEVVGFRGHRTLLMPLESMEGVAYGTPVECIEQALLIPVGEELIGRVLGGLGEPIDGGGPLKASERRAITARPSHPLRRTMLGQPLSTGVRVLDGLVPMARGQRIAINAGSGVGKSTLLGMLARYVEADVIVANLVGERGREVGEFIEHNLGVEGLARSVMVVATSDESPALQIKSTLVATTIAEYFRDKGRDVLLLVDSVTRLALAQRQIGLAAGEPPTTKGYTPSVFALLPPLLERAGTSESGGSVSAVYTVLVEADDDNDPIADAVRGIVDGHVVLSRKLASHGHFPAVDVLSSISRLASRVSTPEDAVAAARFRDLLATWQENEELVRLGAYRRGTSPKVDEALARYPAMEAWLRQPATQPSERTRTLAGLRQVVGAVAPPTRR